MVALLILGMFGVAVAFFYGGYGIEELMPGDYCEHACGLGWGFASLFAAVAVWIVGIFVAAAVVVPGVVRGTSSRRRALLRAGAVMVGWWIVTTGVKLAYWLSTSGGSHWSR